MCRGLSDTIISSYKIIIFIEKLKELIFLLREISALFI